MKQWIATNRLALTLMILLSTAYAYKTSQAVIPATALPVLDAGTNAPSSAGPELHSLDFTSTEIDIDGLLKENFELASRASDGDRDAYAAFLSKLGTTPNAARAMITQGLAQTPRQSAMERAGLLELVPRYADGNQKWAADILETELIENPSAKRLTRREAKTRAEKEQAIAITPDILRSQLAFDSLATVLKSNCPALEQATAKIAMEQKDELLLRGFETRLRSQCPSSHLSFNQD